MNTITIEVTDTELKAMQYAATDPAAWADNVVTNRARIAIDEIVQICVAKCLDAGIQIPATKEEIVNLAFTNGYVRTAAERSAEEEANTPVME